MSENLSANELWGTDARVVVRVVTEERRRDQLALRSARSISLDLEVTVKMTAIWCAAEAMTPSLADLRVLEPPICIHED